MRHLAAGSLLLIACTHPAPVPPAPAPPPVPAAAAATPSVVDLPGAGNGLAIDHGHVYLTDSDGNRIVEWHADSGGFTPVGTLAPPLAEAGGKVGLGGLVRLADGTFVTPSFGFGTAGGVEVLPPTGEAHALANRDPKLRRIAIAASPDGHLYVTYFTTPKGTDGGVAVESFTEAETPIIGGLKKPAGIAATDDELYVCDQDAKTITAYSIKGTDPTTIATALPSCDQLALLPNGDLVTGGRAGEVDRITLHGQVLQLAAGLADVRGIAYDAAAHRLLFVEHARGGTAGGKDRLHVMPYNP
jgi:hypothetical protein